MSRFAHCSSRTMRTALFGIAVLSVLSVRASAQEKIPIKTADELPRHAYKIPGTATDLLKSDEQFAALAKQVRADVEVDLAKYKIEDASTLQRFHNVLLNLDLLEGHYDAALKTVALLRELEAKEAKKLTTGLVAEAYVAAQKQAGTDDGKFRAALRETLLQKLRALPWELVGDDIKQRKGQMDVISESLLMGMVQSSVDPVVAKTSGEVGADIAHQLVSMRFALKVALRLKDDLLAVYKTVVDEHNVAKKDIWGERAVTFTPDQALAPVVVGIWDSGTDPKVFEKQLFVNPKEKPNGKDDDNNSFVDDINGIAYDLDSRPVPALLHPLDGLKRDVNEVAGHMKGFMDLQSAIDSPEASAVKKIMAELKGDDVKSFIEDLGLYGNYAHGTHVAGIALDGNPFARLLIARLTFDYHMIPACPTLERCQRDAEAARATVEYFKHHGVRVVNMSWGRDQKEVEEPLEKNGIGKDPEERATLARAMYKVQRDGLLEAMKGAPDILFVAAAGNSDNDVQFDDIIPSGFDLPNVLIVGAVNQAGEPTSFTSFGRTVQVYANGFEVESYIPGGKRMKLSGTSMASPNVTNLAAKVLAVAQALSPPQVIELIKKGADKVEGKKPMLLINPKRTLELAKK